MRALGAVALLASATAACGSTTLPPRSSASTASANASSASANASSAIPIAGDGLPESDWLDGEPSSNLQQVSDELAQRTLGWLATQAGRNELCALSRAPNATQAGANATKQLTQPLFPMTIRAMRSAELSDPVLHSLLDASRALLMAHPPAVTDVAHGLMWVEADAYRRAVCQPGANTPLIAGAFVAMVNERAHLLGLLDAWVSAPITAPAQPGSYWTQRSDLRQIADRTLTALSETGPAVDDHSTAVMAQATVSGAPFTCEPGALHRFDLGSSGGSNHVLESGELLGVRLRCRNVRRTRMVSQSLLFASGAPGIVYVGGETVLPEVNAGEEFDLPVGPIYVSSVTDARAATLTLRVESSGAPEEGALRLSFRPITVETTGISFATPPDEDRPGSSVSDPQGDGLAGPDDRLELLLRTSITPGFAPTLGPLTFALPADGSVFNLDAMDNLDFAPDRVGAGQFVSVDDLDIRVGPREAFTGLDVSAPVALARLRGNRVARVAISVGIDSPTTLATVAQGLAPAAVLAATGLLAQRQGITAPAAFAALTRAGRLLSPVTAQLRAWEASSHEAAEPPDDNAVSGALAALRAAHLISPATVRSLQTSMSPSDPRALWAVDVMEHLGMVDGSSAAALRANATGRSDGAMSEALRIRLTRWTTLLTALNADSSGPSPSAVLRDVDVLTAEPSETLRNATVLRNVLAIALEAPLRGDGAPAAVTADDGRHGRHRGSHGDNAEAAAPTRGDNMGSILEGVAAACSTSSSPLPTWSFQRYVLLPIESAP
jgi:hypothetical protein